MSISTITFSQFTNAGNLENNATTVGLSGGTNAYFNNPWTFSPPGSTADRPSVPVDGQLRFNTDTQLYEYYNTVSTTWIILEASSGGGTVNPGNANAIAYYPSLGNAVSGLATAANSILVTNNSSVPSLSAALPAAVQVSVSSLNSGTGASSSTFWRGDGTWSAVPATSVPTGTIIDFASTSAPTGYLPCDGSAVSRVTYSVLFGVIGTIWGAGDGVTTFNVPDFTRSVAMGSGGTGTSVIGNSVGDVGGAESVTLALSQIPNHTHDTPNSIISGGSGRFVATGATCSIQNVTQGITGYSAQTPVSIIQPSCIVLKCIKY